MPVRDGKMSTPLTYAIPGHISEEVIADMAQWIIRMAAHPATA